jgi:hypothetical protein
MKKEELLVIADALEMSIQKAKLDARLCEMPATIFYLRSCLIPKLEEAYKIVSKHYHAEEITSDKKIIPSIRNINFNQSDNKPSN